MPIKINADISNRAKFALAYIYIYIYCSLHIKQCLHILIISMTCSLQRPKHRKITIFKTPPPQTNNRSPDIFPALGTDPFPLLSWGWKYHSSRSRLICIANTCYINYVVSDEGYVYRIIIFLCCH